MMPPVHACNLCSWGATTNGVSDLDSNERLGTIGVDFAIYPTLDDALTGAP